MADKMRSFTNIDTFNEHIVWDVVGCGGELIGYQFAIDSMAIHDSE